MASGPDLKTETLWLIKSGSQILGPFTQSDLIQSIRSRKISILDEVKPSQGRWRYLRETVAFEQVVKQVLSEEASGLGTQTWTVEKTPSFTDPGEDLTPTPIFEKRVFDVPPAKEIQAKEKVVPIQETNKKTYVAEIDLKMNQMIRDNEKVNRQPWLILSVVIFIIAGIYFYRSTNKAGNNSDELMKLARKHKDSGNYSEAWKIFQKINTDGKEKILAQKEFLPVILEANPQTVESRRILDEIINSSEISGTEKPDFFIGKAVSFIGEQNFKQAEQELKQALAIDPKHNLAQLNLAVVYYANSQYDEAWEILESLSTKSTVGEYLSLLKGAVLLELKPFQTGKAQETVRELTGWRKSSNEYVWQNSLLIANLQKKIGNEKDMFAIIDRLVKRSPDEVKDYIKPWNLSQWLTGPERITFWIHQLTNESQTAGQYGLKALSFYFKGEFNGALEAIDLARKQFPNNGELLGIHAFLLRSANRGSEAKALVVLDTGKNHELVQQVRYQACLDETDLSCVESAIDQLKSQGSDDLKLLTLKAQAALKKKQKERARQWIEEGLSLKSNYRPLLALRQELGD